MTTAQVVETPFTLNNSPIQGCVHPDHHAQPTYEMTPGFYPYQYGQQNFFPVECLLISLIAFDTVDHKILLVKLNYYGFRGIVNQWFFSYLINRTQTTEIDLFTDTAAILN